MKELERRFVDGFVFRARVVTNKRLEDEPIVTWYDALPSDMFVAAGLARMLVKMTDSSLGAGIQAANEAADELNDQGDGEK